MFNRIMTGDVVYIIFYIRVWLLHPGVPVDKNPSLGKKYRRGISFS